MSPQVGAVGEARDAFEVNPDHFTQHERVVVKSL